MTYFSNGLVVCRHPDGNDGQANSLNSHESLGQPNRTQSIRPNSSELAPQRRCIRPAVPGFFDQTFVTSAIFRRVFIKPPPVPAAAFPLQSRCGDLQ
jgi:hypothetical protein